jgi:RNA 3'-terminal phosphate cyclase (ATP)
LPTTSQEIIIIIIIIIIIVIISWHRVDTNTVQVKSSSIELRPHYLKAGSYEADTQTAGSCTLLAQAALPCAVFANPAAAGQPGCDSVTRLQLRGGTDASMAPPVSYLTDILQPTLRRLLGLDVTVSLIKRGFYPKGGGQVDVTAHALPAGQALPAFDLTTRGNVGAG